MPSSRHLLLIERSALKDEQKQFVSDNKPNKNPSPPPPPPNNINSYQENECRVGVQIFKTFEFRSVSLRLSTTIREILCKVSILGTNDKSAQELTLGGGGGGGGVEKLSLTLTHQGIEPVVFKFEFRRSLYVCACAFF